MSWPLPPQVHFHNKCFISEKCTWGEPTIGFSCNLLQVGLPTGMSSAELSGAATTDDESVTSGQVIFNILLTKSFNLTHLSTPLFLSQAASQRGCVPIYWDAVSGIGSKWRGVEGHSRGGTLRSILDVPEPCEREAVDNLWMMHAQT